MSDSLLARRVARRLLRWYPKPWRARYGIEMRELVDEMPVRWRQVADLAIGAGREWASPRAFGWPARSAAGRIQAARIFKFTFWALVIEAIAHSARGFFPAGTGAIEPTLEPVATTIMMAATLRLVLGWLRWWIRRTAWLLSATEIAIWYVAMLVWLTASHLRPIPVWVDSPGLHVFMYHLQVYIFVNLLYGNSSRTRRLRKIYFAHLKRRHQPSTFYKVR
jgi:hypothetical protein